MKKKEAEEKDVEQKVVEPTVPPKHIRRAEFYKRLNIKIREESHENKSIRKDGKTLEEKNIGWDRDD